MVYMCFPLVMTSFPVIWWTECLTSLLVLSQTSLLSSFVLMLYPEYLLRVLVMYNFLSDHYSLLPRWANFIIWLKTAVETMKFTIWNSKSYWWFETDRNLIEIHKMLHEIVRYLQNHGYFKFRKLPKVCEICQRLQKVKTPIHKPDIVLVLFWIDWNKFCTNNHYITLNANDIIYLFFYNDWKCVVS